MQTGARGTQAVSPRDITGRRARELLNEKKAREKATDNVEAIRRESFKSGFDAAYEAAFQAGWTALAEILTDAGVDVDGVLALDEGEDA
jgi:hypothetical protein